MLVIDSPRARAVAGGSWLVFAAVNTALMYVIPGEETIPYHLVWVTFVFLYGLGEWPLRLSLAAFFAVVVGTGIPLIKHARDGYIGWEESSEIVLMGIIAALLMWHVRRAQAAQRRLAALRESERHRAQTRELTSRFGSHELRTRLTIARSAVELIRGGAGDAQSRADADLAVSEIDKALTTATHLLTLVRVDGPANRRRIDVAAMMVELGRRWEIRADRAWAFEADEFSIDGDQDRIEAALDCLIENAVKFTEVYDTIAVEARADGADVVFSVSDSGAGIPDEDLGRVTELFETASTAGARAGSGLGLAIVRAVAQSRGGTLETFSTLGRGTKVVMRTPQYPVAAERPLTPTWSPLPDTTGASPVLSS
jgi:signal transduction histidine kinase